jgi:hypothetical protein
MNQQPLQILRDWIKTQGPGVCDDPRRVEAYLKDFCGQHKREIFVLVQAIREKVVADLRQGPTPPFTPEIFQARLAQRLHDNLGLSEDIARWTVAGWCEVLEIAVAAPAQTTPTPKKKATRSQKAVASPQPATATATSTAAPNPSGLIANRYEVIENGMEVIDHEERLIWRRMAEPGTFTLEQALKHAAQQAQETGKNWRVPRIKELETLVATGHNNPAINTMAFPGTVPDFFHSSTRNGKLVHAINFQNGTTTGSYPTDADAIRLVRTQPNTHYELSADGQEVTDHKTGLIWRRAVEPGDFTWAEAQAHAKSIARQTGLPWRVPTIDELKTLIDEKRKKRNDRPVIDTDFFPERATERFWSSSPYVGEADGAWSVNFNSGFVGYWYRDYSIAVRLVRGG